MKRIGWFVLALLIASPLSSQPIPGQGGPVPDPPRGGGGGSGFPNIGIGISLGKKKKKPEVAKAPALEMVDADIPDYAVSEALFFVKGNAAQAQKIARTARVEIIETTYLDELG